ncbi:Uric acid degradation bifunctional protein PucL [Luteitalea pratensis]|uniref:2-oxo-4-hydroxy-4-carboxy-5-ureidoimidazoline decarboxylase n=2 Tax=Luteitalea pratensis TaxID=1855912 RepID=A0A143PKG3_LUTPR|nr:Uric acid degradation bifunctional protein PucL [Luteitalea pratensis]
MEEINRLDLAGFVAAVGPVFEHSPWVAARAWPHRPFADLPAMYDAMTRQVLDASRDEQLALLRAHPDLGTRARMSVASEGEQAGAGLDRLTAVQYDRLRAANARYHDRFGFPFLFAVKGSTASDILAALEARVDGAWDAEFETALEQVFRIARFRLQEIVP